MTPCVGNIVTSAFIVKDIFMLYEALCNVKKQTTNLDAASSNLAGRTNFKRG